MTRPTLLIFSKPPRMGLAKTRLADGLGRTEARRIARFTMARTMRAACAFRGAVRLHVEPATAITETLGGLWPAAIPRFAQGSGNLGERLAAAMQAAPPGPVIFIGTDAPDITSAHLHRASKALRHKGAVFGPAADGGFWLFGLSHALRDPSIFADVRWSGPHAMEDVWSHLPGHASVSLLPQLLDIDTAKDWALHRRQHRRAHTHP